MTYQIHGKFNEIHTKNIGNGTHIGNFNYIGKGVKIGKNCKIHNHVEIYDGCIIGDNTIINSMVLLNSDTIVGSFVNIGGMVETADEMNMFVGEGKKKPCIIEDNAMIGQGARLVSCKIGKGAVIGAGAVVLNDVPPNEKWASKPIKAIKIGNNY